MDFVEQSIRIAADTARIEIQGLDRFTLPGPFQSSGWHVRHDPVATERNAFEVANLITNALELGLGDREICLATALSDPPGLSAGRYGKFFLNLSPDHPR